MILPSGQLDPDQTGGHRGAAKAREVLRQDLQRNLPLHPQYMRGLRVIPGLAPDSILYRLLFVKKNIELLKGESKNPHQERHCSFALLSSNSLVLERLFELTQWALNPALYIAS